MPDPGQEHQLGCFRGWAVLSPQAGPWANPVPPCSELSPSPLRPLRRPFGHMQRSCTRPYRCPQATVAMVRCEAEATPHPLLFHPLPCSVCASSGWVWYRAAGDPARQHLLLLLTCNPPAQSSADPPLEGQGELGCRQGCPRCQRRGCCSDLPAVPSEAKRCQADRKPLSEQGQVMPHRDTALGPSPLVFQPGSPAECGAECGAVTRGLG